MFSVPFSPFKIDSVSVFQLGNQFPVLINKCLQRIYSVLMLFASLYSPRRSFAWLAKLQITLEINLNVFARDSPRPYHPFFFFF